MVTKLSWSVAGCHCSEEDGGGSLKERDLRIGKEEAKEPVDPASHTQKAHGIKTPSRLCDRQTLGCHD